MSMSILFCNRLPESLSTRAVFLFLMVITRVHDLPGIPVDGRPAPSLERVVINGDSVICKPSFSLLELDSRHRDVTFDIGSRDTVLSRFCLTGYDKKWGPWSDRGCREYTNLPAGKYKLKVQQESDSVITGVVTLLEIRVLPPWYLSGLAAAMYACLLALITWCSYTFVRLRFARVQHMLEQIINKRTEDLIIEKEKTEKLLANVLPKNTASEIIEKGKATKIKYNFVTVLFSDIQGFTRIAEEVNPEILIDELDKFFFYFDSVVEILGIEKIKTIGDAYMCAGGIPEKNRTNPVEVVLAALEMQGYMRKLKESSDLEGMKYWDIRVGIHTGTVVAGVVGQKKLSYDIWGDTVNTASRMESSGEAGKINISGTTYEFVKDFFICEYRGKMPVKYKGEIEMYFVEGILPGLRDENGKPNGKFILKMQMIKLQDIEDIVIKMFDDEAPPNLYFHNALMVKNTCSQADLLSMAEKLPEEEHVNLKLAAIFLFTGYITDYENPMGASCRVAEEILPKYGFDQENIETVTRLIMNSFNGKILTATDKVLHDSRYDYLGRVDYMKLTEKLFREESENGKSRDRKEWIELQEKLLAEHEFVTDTARMLRGVAVETQAAMLHSRDL
jgi:class 3 adenylate cyclase